MKEEKSQRQIRINWFMILAIGIIVLLLIISFAQIISIKAKNSKIQEQKNQLQELENEQKYYDWLKDNADEENHYDIEGVE